MNHHQEYEGWYLEMLNHRWMFNRKTRRKYIYRENGNRLNYTSAFVFKNKWYDCLGIFNRIYCSIFFPRKVLPHQAPLLLGLPCLWIFHYIFGFISIIHLYIYIYIRRALNKIPDFFRMSTSSTLQSNLLQLKCTCCTVPTTSGRAMEVLLSERVNDLRHSLFLLVNCLITTFYELRK